MILSITADIAVRQFIKDTHRHNSFLLTDFNTASPLYYRYTRMNDDDNKELSNQTRLIEQCPYNMRKANIQSLLLNILMKNNLELNFKYILSLKIFRYCRSVSKNYFKYSQLNFIFRLLLSLIFVLFERFVCQETFSV